MNMLRVKFRDVKRFIEWSFFIEEGDIHAQRGFSSIKAQEIKLIGKLLKKHKIMKSNDKQGFMDLSQYHCQILLDWYQLLPESLLDEDDSDMHATLIQFVCECEK